jgi:hypothetical protein
MWMAFTKITIRVGQKARFGRVETARLTIKLLNEEPIDG